MRSATNDLPSLLTARKLVFSNVTGFTPRVDDSRGREPQISAATPGDRSYWIDSDYFMEEREKRAMRRARLYSDVRKQGHRLIQQVAALLVRRVPAKGHAIPE